MKSRKVSVLVEIDTDEKLVRLGRKELWREATEPKIRGMLTGSYFEITGAKAMVIQPSKAEKKRKKAVTRG